MKEKNQEVTFVYSKKVNESNIKQDKKIRRVDRDKIVNVVNSLLYLGKSKNLSDLNLKENCKTWIHNLISSYPAIDDRDAKELLKVASGGIIFTTIQKFFPEEDREKYPLLSERDNIIVIADEAHRSQYGFSAKIQKKNDKALITFGYAKYIRDALPNASFIGFTGTPIEKADRSTPAVFGNYIDVYDIEQAVKDGVTVTIYYESRLARLELKPEEKPKIDEEFEEVTEGEEVEGKEWLKTKWGSTRKSCRRTK